jgi:hypothetical protein
MQVKQRLKIKQIHSFANDHHRSWFPRLHSYEAFVIRINRLSEVFKHISGTLLSNNCPEDSQSDTSLVDSLPIITSFGKRPNAVAKELTDKGFCFTKNMYYH